MSQTVLGFDYGERQIGVAVAHTGTGQAHPLATVANRDGAADWDHVQRLIDEWQPTLLVVGLPLNMDGTDMELTPKARKFGHRLNGRYNRPVTMVDERLTTHAARNELYASGVRSRKQRAIIDQLAAQHILETWLHEQPGDTGNSPDDRTD